MSSAPDRTPAENTGDEPTPAAVPPAGPAGSSGLVFDDPLDRPSSDDTDRGWGERPSSGSAADDDDFTRFLNEKPPHHL
jgi:acetyl-CoA synthetase